jgi:hypothetical protein
MVGQGEQPTKKLPKRSPEKQRKRSPVWPDWNKWQSGKDTMTDKIIQDCQRMVLGMAPFPGDTTQSSISNSETGHG